MSGMKEMNTCNAKTRPLMCKYDFKKCCFFCEYNDECTTEAKKKKEFPLPCVEANFAFDNGDFEVCEFGM